VKDRDLVGSEIARLTFKAAGKIEDTDRLDEDLGLSSLDRVDLLSQLETQCGKEFSEAEFTEVTTVAELRQWLDRDGRDDLAKARTDYERQSARQPVYRPPVWTLRPPIRWARTAIRNLVMLPLLNHYMQLEVQGVEHLSDLQPPLIFAANHSSNLDTVAVLAALPRAWRYGLAPAVRLEYFAAHFDPGRYSFLERFQSSFEYALACGVFNAYPVPQRTSGLREFSRYAGDLADRGYSTLIFPEGKRTADGTLNPFKPGVGLLATRLELPVIPIGIHGTFEILSKYQSWPKTGPIRVHFGPAHRFDRNQTADEVTEVLYRAVEGLYHFAKRPLV
jgi:long-chain acyl-CoA synthetase